VHIVETVMHCMKYAAPVAAALEIERLRALCSVALESIRMLVPEVTSVVWTELEQVLVAVVVLELAQVAMSPAQILVSLIS